MTVAITVEHNEARLAGTLAFLDAGSNPARLRIYGGTRPVGLSRTQFDYAHAKGDAYWLYVVEYATDAEKARVLRIQNPVGHARTFTFDKGWSQVARTEPPKSSQPKA